MNCSNIKNFAYSGAGGFAAGTIAAIGLLSTFTAKTAGPGLAIIPGTGLLFAGTAVVSRVVNEIFKKMGCINHPHSRLIAAHTVVAIALSPAIVATTGFPVGLAVTMAIVITCASLGVNLLVNHWIKKHD
ncbi:MAG: hypothetical protein LLG04_17185 [Parachlamydia sp.]|nr:hypothetical protein [Parachlamydia sp.]